jgi:hypothetical protein
MFMIPSIVYNIVGYFKNITGYLSIIFATIVTFRMLLIIFVLYFITKPVTVAEQSKACTVFARSEAGIVGSNPTQGMDVWCVYVFILCLCCPVFRTRPCDELITRQRSPTDCQQD